MDSGDSLDSVTAMFQLGWNAQLLGLCSPAKIHGACVGCESRVCRLLPRTARVELRMGWSQTSHPFWKHPGHSACVPLRLPAAFKTGKNFSVVYVCDP